MKREIKFRGQRKLNGNWVFGSYIYIGEDWCQIVPLGTEYDEITYDKMRVITESVGQYTGLKDKNGKEIFDGDIVKTKDEVVWITDVLGYNHMDFNNFIYSVLYSEEHSGIWGMSQSEIEIIGNIHEPLSNE